MENCSRAASATACRETRDARMAEAARARARRRAAIRIRGQLFAAPPLEPGLYVVATPIGNLGDITIRALDTLAGADLVACEDTRVTASCSTATASTRRSSPITSTAARRRTGGCSTRSPRAARWRSSPTPARRSSPIPARALVADAIAAGHRVVPIPGPSSLVAALSAAGLPTDEVLFLGFLPSKARRGESCLEVARADRRDAGVLRIAEPHRRAARRRRGRRSAASGTAAVCRELTKIHETFDRGTLAELAARYADRDVKGEIVLVVAPPGARPRRRTKRTSTHALRDALQTIGREGSGADGRRGDRPFAPRALSARAGAEGRRLTSCMAPRPPRRLSPRPCRRGGRDCCCSSPRAFG